MIKLNKGLRRNVQKYCLPDVLLEGDRVYLCPPSLDDWQEWVVLRERNQEFLKPYEPTWSENFRTYNYFLKRLERQKREWLAGRGAYFLIHKTNTHEIIGGVNLNSILLGVSRHATFGYWLGEEHQGHGFMNESLQLVIDYAFDELKLKRLNAATLLDNARSYKLLTNLGFEEEGLAKSYVQIDGVWQDHKLFGLVNPKD